MKLFALLIAALLVSGCTSRTDFGECIGVMGDKDPSLNYELSVANTVIAIVLVETIIVPVVVVANQAICPRSKK